MREYQVRICEGLGVKFPGPTRRASTVTNARGSRTPITGPTCTTTRLAGRRPSIQPGFPQGLGTVQTANDVAPDNPLGQFLQ